jgi:hypothetical protein
VARERDEGEGKMIETFTKETLTQNLHTIFNLRESLWSVGTTYIARQFTDNINNIVVILNCGDTFSIQTDQVQFRL